MLGTGPLICAFTIPALQSCPMCTKLHVAHMNNFLSRIADTLLCVQTRADRVLCSDRCWNHCTSHEPYRLLFHALFPPALFPLRSVFAPPNRALSTDRPCLAPSSAIAALIIPLNSLPISTAAKPKLASSALDSLSKVSSTFWWWSSPPNFQPKMKETRLIPWFPTTLKSTRAKGAPVAFTIAVSRSAIFWKVPVPQKWFPSFQPAPS